MAVETIVEKAIKILRRYPLCDHCLGRMFARLGIGFSNSERGKAIKTMIVMEIHRRIAGGEQGALETFRELASRLAPYSNGLAYKYLGMVPEDGGACYVCGGLIGPIIDEGAERGYHMLTHAEIKRFLVGVKLARDVHEKEERLKSEFGLPYAESVKNEIKREIGKRIQEKGLIVDFEEPEGLLIVHFPKGRLEIEPAPIFYKARYWKIGRYISQSYWPSKEGSLKYKFSVEQAAKALAELHKAEDVVIHASGREDADARMLGTGRPLVIEVKRPYKRRVQVWEAEETLNTGGRGLVRFKIEGYATRALVRLYKGELAGSKKTYKALVVSEDPLTKHDLERIESFFDGRTIEQRTPTRVLHRRADIVRRKKVYHVSTYLLSRYVFLAVIEADGGLYIKELISGDDGRTSPSFSSITGKNMVCADLDVVAVDLGKPLNTV